MQNIINFDLEKYEIENEFEHLPPGEYSVEIIECENKRTAKAIELDTNECYLNVKLRVIKDGRLIWDCINIINENEKAQTIGRSRLKTLAHFSNRIHILTETHDVNCLIGGVVGIVVVKEKELFGKRTKVKYYKPSEKVKERDSSLSDEKGIGNLFISTELNDEIPF